MLRSSVVRTVTTRAGSCRTMAGGFPTKMRVKKNKFVEEWNGRREITEEGFSMDQAKLTPVIMCLVVFPLGIYYWTRGEFISRGDRRYKEMV